MSANWYVAKRARGRQQRIGPLTFDQLRAMAADGRLQPADLVYREGTENWLPAERVEEVFPAGPALPPLPPDAPPRRDRHDESRRDAGPRRQTGWPLSTPLTILLASLLGGGLLGLVCCGGLALMGPDGWGGGPWNGGGMGGGLPVAGGALQGTYQRRSNDGVSVGDHITFTADGRFQEERFLTAAAVNRHTVGADGQIYPDIKGQSAGQGTYRFNGSTLELTYTDGGQVRVNCAVMGSGELLINTYYTFIRVQ